MNPAGQPRGGCRYGNQGLSGSHPDTYAGKLLSLQFLVKRSVCYADL